MQSGEIPAPRVLDGLIVENLLGWKYTKVGPDYYGQNECEVLCPPYSKPGEHTFPYEGKIPKWYLAPCYSSDLGLALKLAGQLKYRFQETDIVGVEVFDFVWKMYNQVLGNVPVIKEYELPKDTFSATIVNKDIGLVLFSVISDNKTLWGVWDVAQGKQSVAPIYREIRHIYGTKTFSLFAVTGTVGDKRSTMFIEVYKDGGLRVLNGAVDGALIDHRVSPIDGKMFITMSFDGLVKVMDLTTGKIGKTKYRNVFDAGEATILRGMKSDLFVWPRGGKLVKVDLHLDTGFTWGGVCDITKDITIITVDNRKDWRYGAIDCLGDVVVPVKYNGYDKYGRMYVFYDDKVSDVYDKHGKFTGISFKGEIGVKFFGGVMLVKNGDKTLVVDRHFNTIKELPEGARVSVNINHLLFTEGEHTKFFTIEHDNYGV